VSDLDALDATSGINTSTYRARAHAGYIEQEEGDGANYAVGGVQPGMAYGIVETANARVSASAS
jgi:hypothetical protein